MSFDRYNSKTVLNMMRGMSFLHGLGLGRCQHGTREFTLVMDHDFYFGLVYKPKSNKSTKPSPRKWNKTSRKKTLEESLLSKISNPRKV